MFDSSRFYSAGEVWRLSHAPREFVYQALRSGDLRSIRRGKRFIVPGGALVDWLERLAAEGAR